MSLAAKLLSASGGGTDKLYVDDVFSTYLYNGNGSTQTINNRIDLAGKGGMVWAKSRNTDTGHTGNHYLLCTARPNTASLRSNTTESEITSGGSFPDGFYTPQSTGFTARGGMEAGLNEINNNYVSWTFRKASKFFDVVTYTGNGVAGRQIPHSLGIAPGMVIIKCTNYGTNWAVSHRTFSGGQFIYLNQTSAAASGGNSFFPTNTHSASTFTVGSDFDVNWNGFTYVAYLFAHDTSADGIIQCGSFTTDGSGNATVTLGWEPQFLITKAASTTNGWWMQDAMRGLTANNAIVNTALIQANISNAEEPATGPYVHASGFYGKNLVANQTYIYLAIRRPNKPPTTGTQVYSPKKLVGGSNFDFSFDIIPDTVISWKNTQSTIYSAPTFHDRLRGFGNDMIGNTNVYAAGLFSSSNDAESTNSNSSTPSYLSGSAMGRFVYGGGWYGYTGSFHGFRRRPGFFDVVCYTGTGVARTVAHNLGVAPELMIVKRRSSASDWTTYVNAIGPTKYLALNLNYGSVTDATIWNNTAPTSTGFSVGNAETNNNGDTHVAYLFATLSGISKVGSYTGNGSTQTINCGFTTGARFVLIKRTDSTGDWYVWDSVRGIISANDPHLSLNTTAAEVTTDDSVDPAASGFAVNQVAATNINVSGGTYIFLAIA